MAELINMPKLGFDMQEGTLSAWLKKVGDYIEAGDVLAEIETDKATVEVETYATGTLLHVMAQPGDVLAVGSVIAVIGESGEDVQEALSGSATPAEQAPPAAAEPAPTPATAEAPHTPAPAPASAPSTSSAPPIYGAAEIKASPVARRLAYERGIDLRQIQGSGPGGRIIKQDIDSAVPAPRSINLPSQAAGAGLGAAPSYKVMQDIEHYTVPVSRLRATIARRMVESKQWVPHFTVTTAMDTTKLLALRKQINERLSDDDKVTVNDMLVKAVALALRRFPNLNTHFHGDQLVRYNAIHIGMAVALPEGGLINVVARNADVVSLSALAKKNKTMIAGAREGKVKPEDIEGSTFTVSNLGAYGVEHFTAIINPPEAGILAIGASQQIPVVNVEGELTIGNVMKVTLSVDHRVSDGAEGAQFVAYFKELIEDPMRLLV